jgi:hypothetical protein
MPSTDDKTYKEKKNEIRDLTCALTYEDRMSILQILRVQLEKSKIIESADGCRINLETLPDEMIDKLHHIVTSKVKVSADNLIV